MNSKEEASQLIAQQSEAYVKKLEVANAKDCEKKIRERESEKLRGVQVESKAAKDEADSRMNQAESLAKNVEYLQEHVKTLDERKECLQKGFIEVLNDLKQEKIRYNSLRNTLSSIKIEAQSLETVESESYVTIDEAQKWEHQQVIMKERRLQLEEKTAALETMKARLAERREQLNKKNEEKALLRTKLGQLQQEKAAVLASKQEKEGIFTQLHAELTEKEAAVSLKRESCASQMEGSDRLNISKSEVKLALMQYKADSLPVTMFVEKRLELRSAQKEARQDMVTAKEQELGAVKTKHGELRKVYSEKIVIQEKLQKQKEELVVEMNEARDRIEEQKRLRELFKKPPVSHTTPDLRPFASSTPIVPRKELQNRYFVTTNSKDKKLPAQPIATAKRGRPKKPATQVQVKKKGTKRAWEDSDSGEEWTPGY